LGFEAWYAFVADVDGRALLVRPVFGVRTDVIPADRSDPLLYDP
jgi:hypothetical protein